MALGNHKLHCKREEEEGTKYVHVVSLFDG